MIPSPYWQALPQPREFNKGVTGGCFILARPWCPMVLRPVWNFWTLCCNFQNSERKWVCSLNSRVCVLAHCCWHCVCRTWREYTCGSRPIQCETTEEHLSPKQPHQTDGEPWRLASQISSEPFNQRVHFRFFLKVVHPNLNSSKWLVTTLTSPLGLEQEV